MEGIREPYHVPALLEETINLLDIKPDGIYVDVTFGGGGHSRAIMERLGENGRLFSFDRDIDAYQNRIDDDRFTFVHSNFRHIENFMRFYKVNKVDGILADFGVSFHHFDTAERGFSFRYDSPLDMRMNRDASRNAYEIINESDEQQIRSILQQYANLKKPGLVAKAITDAKNEKPLETTFQLADAIKKVVDPRQEKKEMAQVFQAFRIAVNNEAEDLVIFLQSTEKILKPGGRLVTLTYHSMEDKLVKNFMKTGDIDGVETKDFFGNLSSPWKMLTRKPIEPSMEEIERNPRSRSARLRAAQFLGNEISKS